MTIEKITDEVIRICRRHGVRELFLFGSYAEGTAAPTSDIDFVVKGAEDVEALREQIDEIPTLKKIDVFDYDTCENPDLKEAMDRYGKKIY